MRRSFKSMALPAVALMLGTMLATLTGCGSGGGDSTVTTLRFSGIPDQDKEKLTKQYQVVTDYLKGELGIDVEFKVASDYTAAVTALAANKLDLVWLGGVTSVQAEQRTDGDVTFVTTRDTDLKFKSYFIAHKSTGIEKADSLEDLADALGKHSFTFGSKSSTSGHIMPRHFMTQAGLIPVAYTKGTDFKPASRPPVEEITYLDTYKNPIA